MIRILKSLAAKIWLSIILLVMIAGLVIGGLRLLLPQMGEYREQVAVELSALLGAPVRIGRFGARLAGLSPELKLTTVEVLDANREQALLTLGEVYVRLALLDSLMSGEPRLALVTMVGVRLELLRRVDGHVVISGLGDAGAVNRSTQISPLLFFGDGRLQLQDSEIVWRNLRLGLPPVRFHELNASLTNAGGRHQLDVRAKLDGSDTAGMEVKADLFGAAAMPGNWSGELYLKGMDLSLSRLFGEMLPENAQFAGRGELEAWSTWEQGRAVLSEGRLRLRDLRLGGEPGPSSDTDPVVRELSTGFRWTAEHEGWSMHLLDLGLDVAGDTGPNTGASMRFHRTEGAGFSLRAQLAQVRLDDLAHIGRRLSLPDGWAERLAGLSPRGRLSDLRLELSEPVGGELQWRAAGRLQGLRLQAFSGIPAIDGLDAEFSTEADKGLFALSSDALTLNFVGLFRDPLYFERLDGELYWRLNEAGIAEIGASQVVLNSPDLRTKSRLLLRFPHGGDTFIDLQTDFQDGNGANTSFYLPSGLLSKELIDWLDEGIVSGHVPSGAFVLRGLVGDFPFNNEEGRFEVLFGVEDVILDYQKGWPRLEEIEAEVRFLNERLELHVHDARLLASHVSDVKAVVKDMDHSDLLFLKGRIDGPFSDALRYLRETPLADDLGRYVKGMQARGRSSLDINMQVPLEDGNEFKVDGRLKWNGAELSLSDWGVNLRKLQGQLKITDNGLYADELKAQVWDDPVVLRVDTLEEDGDAAATRINVDLQLNPRRLKQPFPHWLWDQLEGRSAGRLRLDIGHDDTLSEELPIDYRFDSDLRGISVSLPDPLGKARQQRRALSISGSLPMTADKEMRIGYGNLAGAFRFGHSELSGFSLQAAQVVCGNETVPRSGQTGIALMGKVPMVDVGAWRDWFKTHQTRIAEPLDGGLLSPSQQVELQIGELVVGNMRLKDVGLDVVRTPNAWDAEIKSNKLAGHIRLPDDPRHSPISAQFSRFRLDPQNWGDEKISGAAPVNPERDWPDPQQVAGFYLDIDDLRMGEQAFGRLSIKALPVPAGMRFEHLELTGPLVNLTGSGDWIGGIGVQHTRLHLDGSSPDGGDLVRALGYESAVDGAGVAATADLHWDAPPLEVDLRTIAGELSFKFGKGRVLEVDPGMGRLFGLLNLGAVRRRLTLDFSDMFKKGYAFDSIEGAFTLASGQAKTEQVQINGVAADLTISGRAGLLDRDYEQIVTVTPEFSTALPVAGAVVGGPVVAAALLVAEQIMGSEVNKLTRYQYRVSGSWDNPSITPIQTQDGWSLSNLLRPAAPSADSDASEAPVRQYNNALFEH